MGAPSYVCFYFKEIQLYPFFLCSSTAGPVCQMPMPHTAVASFYLYTPTKVGVGRWNHKLKDYQQHIIYAKWRLNLYLPPHFRATEDPFLGQQWQMNIKQQGLKPNSRKPKKKLSPTVQGLTACLKTQPQKSQTFNQQRQRQKMINYVKNLMITKKALLNISAIEAMNYAMSLFRLGLWWCHPSIHISTCLHWWFMAERSALVLT